MNRETDTLLLQTIGKFISLQVQSAVAPLAETIRQQQVLIENLRGERTNVTMQIDGLIESLASEVARVEKLVTDIPKQEVIHGKDGKDAEPVDFDMIRDTIAFQIEEQIKKFSVADGKDGKDGKDCDWNLVNEQLSEGVQMIRGELKKYIDELPKPKDGKDGTDADMDALFVYIENYIKAIPVPKDGGDGKDGAEGKTGAAGRDGVNGADVVAAFRDSDRHLVLTLSNGIVKDIGPIHGTDGKDGAPGKDGKDGRDGFSLDDFEVVKIDHRTIKMYFARGDLKTEREFHFPVLIDRGVWRQGDYLEGDVVTYGGSLFIAQRDTSRKPETEDWRLAVKKGLNGSNGAEGPQGKQGPPGKDGRDLTQLGQDGKKWG